MNDVDHSFASDILESSMVDMIMEGFRVGEMIDYTVESEIEHVGLFESEADKERKRKLSGIEPDLDMDDLMSDGDMIDDVI